MSEELEATYRAFLDDAITRGYEQLREGRSGLDVVVNVIQLWKTRPYFTPGAAQFIPGTGHMSSTPPSCMARTSTRERSPV